MGKGKKYWLPVYSHNVFKMLLRREVKSSMCRKGYVIKGEPDNCFDKCKKKIHL